MDLTTILVSAASLGGIGAGAAGLLAIASRFFRVEEDTKVVAITEALPGANCGGCGFAGCAGYAAAVAAGKAEPNACTPGGAETARKIGEILGVAVSTKERAVARLHCQGGIGIAAKRIEYLGYESCKSLTLLVPGGSKICPQGCEGLGDCVAACAFGAIKIGEKRLPVIDEEKCTGCGKCVAACPKRVLHMEAQSQKLVMGCSTKLAAKLVRKACTTGCLQCKACIRACPYDALIWDGLPKRIDEKCKACGLCVEACKPQSLLLLREPDPAVKEEAKRLIAERKAAAKPAAPAAEAKPEEPEAQPAAASGEKS